MSRVTYEKDCSGCYPENRVKGEAGRLLRTDPDKVVMLQGGSEQDIRDTDLTAGLTGVSLAGDTNQRLKQ